MTNLRLVPTSRKHPAEPPVPDPERDPMLEVMRTYSRALVRQRFLQRHDLEGDPRAALGGRPTRKPFVRRSA